jgi:hypothetical protein
MSCIDQRPDDAMDGAFTAVGPEVLHTVEPAVFREAMSRLGAAVHVVTTAGPGGKAGTTVTAVCSVSDAPPTLLMCLNQRSHTNPAVVENGVLRQHARRRRSRRRGSVCRPHWSVRQRSLRKRGLENAVDRQSRAGVGGHCI